MLLDITFKVTTSAGVGYAKATVDADEWPSNARCLANMQDEFGFEKQAFVLLYGTGDLNEANAFLVVPNTVQRIEVTRINAVDEGE